MMKPLTSRISFPAAVMLMLLPVTSPRAAPLPAPDGKALAGKLLSYLGPDQAKRAQLESGDVVDNGPSGRELHVRFRLSRTAALEVMSSGSLTRPRHTTRRKVGLGDSSIFS
jgi:hypothetical protein